MTEEKKQQTPVGLLARADTQQERVDESYDKSVIDAPGGTLAPGSFFSGLIDDIRIYSRVASP
jgi:hypothetical protein